jgi:hypothetical protein
VLIDAANEAKEVRVVVKAEAEEQHPLAVQLRAEILKEFEGRVFCDRVHPDPPPRGQHGMAVLRLKPNAQPVVGRVIHLKGERLEALREMEEECRRDRKVEPGRGPWRAAAFPIRKKNGKWRMVCDYAVTNLQIMADSYPLPLTEEIVAEQAKCTLFSTIDLRDAFHQVALAEESRPVTNVQLPGGLWQWRVVPQGINVGPALLQRDIDATCAAVKAHSRPYFDDIIVSTRQGAEETDEEFYQKHARDVRETLLALEKDRWVSDSRKVKLFMRQVEFVGHVLGHGRRAPAPGKLSAVQHWQLPPTVSSLRAFLGVCNYYAGYVRLYAELAAPLQEKLKLPRELTKAGSKHPVVWTEQEKEAFDKLKKALVADLELYHIDPAKPFVLRTDASDYAIGAVLEQFPKIDGVPRVEDLRPGASVPVAFMSRKLTEGQRLRWDVRDKETYAVVAALDKWAGFLLDNEILVLTDHRSLESWYKEYVAGVGPQGRRARWHAKLNEFRITVVHVPGETNVVGDAMSRWAYPASQGWRDTSWHGTEADTKEMKAHILEEKLRENSTPKAVHPEDEETKAEQVERSTLKEGRELAVIQLIPLQSFAAVPSASHIAVTTRSRLDTQRNARDAPADAPHGTRSEHPREMHPSASSPAAAAVPPSASSAAVPPSASCIASPASVPAPSSNAPSPVPSPAPQSTAPQSIAPSAAPTAGVSSPAMPVPASAAGVPSPAASVPSAVPSAGVPSTADPVPPQPDLDINVFDMDWSKAYAVCPRWKPVWDQAHNGPGWPSGFQLVDGRLVSAGRWCVPSGLLAEVLREQHSVSGHIGGDRLVEEAERTYVFADRMEAAKVAGGLQRTCPVCQATEHPHQPLRLKVCPTPVPPYIMASVAIDLFVMPEVDFEGQLYNVFAACVDRHSGWVVATAHHTRGLTAATVAKAMYRGWWSPHGLPSVITSDRGPHFAGAWWRSMCGLHGIRHAYAQAYHHAANGRAESLGAQLQKRIRSEKAEAPIPWVESLPRAVQKLNDSKAQHGLSPYEVLYGRHRWTGGVPYKAPVMVDDAVSFFERQKAVDQKVADVLNDLHKRQADQKNRSRKDLEEFAKGDLVWYLRPPRRPGQKLESYWLGPARVTARRGEHSYELELEEGRRQEAHRCQLKAYRDDTRLWGPPKMFVYRQARPQEDVDIEEWTVEEIRRHRRRDDGDWEFEVKWKGHPTLTWEPLKNFFHRYSHQMIEYAKSKKLKVDLLDYLHRNPAEVAVIIAEVKKQEQEVINNAEWEDPPEEWVWPDEDIKKDEEASSQEGESAVPPVGTAVPAAQHVPTRDPPPALGQDPPRTVAAAASHQPVPLHFVHHPSDRPSVSAFPQPSQEADPQIPSAAVSTLVCPSTGAECAQPVSAFAHLLPHAAPQAAVAASQTAVAAPQATVVAASQAAVAAPQAAVAASAMFTHSPYVPIPNHFPAAGGDAVPPPPAAFPVCTGRHPPMPPACATPSPFLSHHFLPAHPNTQCAPFIPCPDGAFATHGSFPLHLQDPSSASRRREGTTAGVCVLNPPNAGLVSPGPFRPQPGGHPFSPTHGYPCQPTAPGVVGKAWRQTVLGSGGCICGAAAAAAVPCLPIRQSACCAVDQDAGGGWVRGDYTVGGEPTDGSGCLCPCPSH